MPIAARVAEPSRRRRSPGRSGLVPSVKRTDAVASWSMSAVVPRRTVAPPADGVDEDPAAAVGGRCMPTVAGRSSPAGASTDRSACDVQTVPSGRSGCPEPTPKPKPDACTSLPHAQFAQHAQGVALEGDAGAGGGVPVVLGLDQVDGRDRPGAAGWSRRCRRRRRRSTRTRAGCASWGTPLFRAAVYLTAIGLTGEPTAPVMGRGAAVSQNSYTPSAAQSVGEGVEVPHLADEQADVGDGDLVQRLEGVLELVGPDLEAPGVGGDRGDLACGAASRPW